MPSILVFPSSLRAAAQYAADARRNGYRVVGASSLPSDPFADAFDAWYRLPFIHDPDFGEQFSALVHKEQVVGVHCPHVPIYRFFRDNLERMPVDVKLIGADPAVGESENVIRLRQDAARLSELLQKYSSEKCQTQDGRFIASLLAATDRIFGECPEEKILAFFSIFSTLPHGDVIEIGTFFGKSAYVLHSLAMRFGVGPMLAIDSWNEADAIQLGSPVLIQELAGAWNWDIVFEGFLFNLATASASFNYLRSRSDFAWNIYDGALAVETPEFGRTDYSGGIALLHIDGNHDEGAVATDYRLWASRLVRGGWIVFDDYVWAHGDGPRKVADRVMTGSADRVRRSFIAGSALFLQLD